MPQLTSWKEIANHLGVSTRTAQLWEVQRQLPVRRLPGPRGRVLATTEELDQWRLSGTGPATIGTEKPGLGARVSRRRWWLAIPAVAVFAGMLVIGRQGREPLELKSFEPTLLTSDLGEEFKPSLSPDGSSVAYLERLDGETETAAVIREIGTGNKRVVARGLRSESSIHWSGDGQRLAFTEMQNGRAVLRVQSARGGTARNVYEFSGPDRTFNAMESLRVAWMPNFDEICLSDREAPNEPLGLFLVDTRTGRRRRLTLATTNQQGDVQCAPAPDGKSVAFVRQQTVSEGDVFLLDRSSGQVQRLTRRSGHFLGLAWLPNGSGLLAGYGAGTANSGIWHISIDGKEPRRLTGREATTAFPSVADSPSGVQVVFQSHTRDMNVWRWSKKTGPQRVTNSIALDHYPAVSPSGEVAWISRRTGAPEVWIAHSDGTNPVQLSHQNGAYIDFPRWSPNSEYLAYATMNNGSRDISVESRKTLERTAIPGAGSEEGRASFARNGRFLYFRSDRSGSREIWKTPLTGLGKAIQMTDRGGYEAFEDPTGNWLYFVKERETPGLWRMPSNGGTAELISREVWEGRWAIGPDGIYVLERGEKGASVARIGWHGEAKRRILDIPAGKSTEAGLAVSADGQWIYWAQLDGYSADLLRATIR